MIKHRIILSFLITALMATAVYGQGKPRIDNTKTVSGIVKKIDFVGGTISILTDDTLQMSFLVSNNAIIMRDTQSIGLMDIKEGHPVTIQYDIASPGRDIAKSIVDNKPNGLD